MDKNLAPFSILALFLLILIAVTAYTAHAQITIDCSSNSCSFSIQSNYTTQSSACESRTIDVVVNNCSVNITYYSITDRYTMCKPAFIMNKSGDYVVLSRMTNTTHNITLNYVVCQSQFCSITVNCNNCTVSGSLDLQSPNCGGSSGGNGCECAWWDIPCHLGCIFSWLINAILGLLQSFFNWISEQIINLLPQPIKDFFNFMGQLFAFLGDLLVKMIEYFPYFVFTITLILSFGLIYYIVEYGAVGVAMYFEMLYDLFKKFVELIIKFFDLIVPF